MNKDWNLSWMG